MASSFGQYTSGISPIQGIAEAGSVVAGMQLKAWDTVGKQFSEAIEEYAKKDAYQKMQDAIAKSSSTADISQRLTSYAEKLDPTKTVQKNVEDALVNYKSEMNAMQDVASKQGGTVNVLDDDTFRSGYLKSMQSVVKNRKDIHPDLQWSLLKDIDLEMNASSELPEDDQIAGERLMDEDYARTVSPTDKTKSYIKHKLSTKDELPDINLIKEDIDFLKKQIPLVKDSQVSADTLQSKIKEKEALLSSTLSKKEQTKKDLNTNLNELAAQEQNLKAKAKNEFEKSAAERAIKKLQETKDLIVSDKRVTLFDNFAIGSIDLKNVPKEYREKYKKDWRNLYAEVTSKEESELYNILDKVRTPVITPEPPTATKRAEQVAFLDSKIKEYQSKLSNSTKLIENPVEKTGEDIANKISGQENIVNGVKQLPITSSIEVTKEEAKASGANFDGGEFIYQQQLDRAEKKAATRQYYEQAFGRVPWNFDALFDAQSPEPKIKTVTTNGVTRDLMMDNKGEWKELSARKTMTQEDISKEKMFSYGATDNNGTRILDKNGKYIPIEIAKGSGIFVSGNITGDVKTVTKIRENVSNNAEAIAIVKKEILPMFDQSGVRINPKYADKLTPVFTKLKAKIRPEAIGTGSVSDWEQKQLRDALADPTKFWQFMGGERAKADMLIKMLEEGIENEAIKGEFQVINTGTKPDVQQSALAKINNKNK